MPEYDRPRPIPKAYPPPTPPGTIVGRIGGMMAGEGLPTAQALEQEGYQHVPALDQRLLEDLHKMSREDLIELGAMVFPSEVHQEGSAEAYFGDASRENLADFIWKNMIVFAPTSEEF